MELVDRPEYLSWIDSHIGAPMAKVLTGMRRAGKSSLLALTERRLRTRGVAPERIISLNFDRMGLDRLASPAELNAKIMRLAPVDGPVHVLLDEIQEVPKWERVVNSLLADQRFDIFVTGSNSTLLASELATYIAGRYVSLPVATLSFAEHLVFRRALSGQSDLDTSAEFVRYLRRGGFPGMYATAYDETETWQALNDIYASTLIRDAVTRRRIRNPELLERIAMFALDNVGSIFSVNSITRYLKSQQRPTNHQTVAEYMAALTESFLLNKVPRFDLRGRGQLAVNEKYYAGDHGLVNAVLGYSDSRLPGLLENIVWAELRRRGYAVWIGQQGAREVDFVAERSGQRIYLQVAMTALDATTNARERAPLEAIRDSFPKYLLTLDPLPGGDDRGIRHRQLPTFLLDQTWSQTA
jgi:predicted AAA+ superfamily ATPase